MRNRDIDLKGQNIVVWCTIAATIICYGLAPWVWPIGALFGVIAGGVIYAARGGHARSAGIVGILAGIAGSAGTLPPSSIHSFLVPANWSHLQMLPLLSLYSVALIIEGVWLLLRARTKGKGTAAQR